MNMCDNCKQKCEQAETPQDTYDESFTLLYQQANDAYNKIKDLEEIYDELFFQ